MANILLTLNLECLCRWRQIFNQDDKYGWCDKEGKFIINPQFDDAVFSFGDSKLASIKKVLINGLY
jgi:hypothetical protein